MASHLELQSCRKMPTPAFRLRHGVALCLLGQVGTKLGSVFSEFHVHHSRLIKKWSWFVKPWPNVKICEAIQFDVGKGHDTTWVGSGIQKFRFEIRIFLEFPCQEWLGRGKRMMFFLKWYFTLRLLSWDHGPHLGTKCQDLHKNMQGLSFWRLTWQRKIYHLYLDVHTRNSTNR